MRRETWPRPSCCSARRSRWPRGALLRGDLVFGWRLRLKHQLVSGRLALICGSAERARAEARALAVRAAELGVPRYGSVARLLGYRADHALGVPVDYAAVEVDLDLLDRCVAIEAWRWTCDLAADFGLAAWRDRALDRASRLARDTSEYSDVVRQEANRRLYRRSPPGLPGRDRHPGRGGGLWLRL